MDTISTLDSTLIDFTENTSYTYTLGSTSPYTTYRVVATYRGYSGLQGEAATYTLKEPEQEEPVEPETPEEPTPPETEIPTDEQSCIKAGGTWDSTTGCTLPTTQ